MCVFACGQLEEYRLSMNECASSKISASEGTNSTSSLSLPGFGGEMTLAQSCVWDFSADMSSERKCYGT